MFSTKHWKKSTYLALIMVVSSFATICSGYLTITHSVVWAKLFFGFILTISIYVTALSLSVIYMNHFR